MKHASPWATTAAIGMTHILFLTEMSVHEGRECSTRPQNYGSNTALEFLESLPLSMQWL